MHRFEKRARARGASLTRAKGQEEEAKKEKKEITVFCATTSQVALGGTSAGIACRHDLDHVRIAHARVSGTHHGDRQNASQTTDRTPQLGSLCIDHRRRSTTPTTPIGAPPRSYATNEERGIIIDRTKKRRRRRPRQRREEEMQSSIFGPCARNASGLRTMAARREIEKRAQAHTTHTDRVNDDDDDDASSLSRSRSLVRLASTHLSRSRPSARSSIHPSYVGSFARWPLLVVVVYRSLVGFLSVDVVFGYRSVVAFLCLSGLALVSLSVSCLA